MRQRKTERIRAGPAFRFLFGAVAVLLASAGTGAGAGEGTEYRRIVSINLAADEILLELVEPERIAALSLLVSDPELSLLAERAAAFPSTGRSVEEVLRFEPDIVFASRFTPRHTTAMLERFGIEVVRLPAASSFAECRALLLDVAARLGVRERGEALAEEMDRRLAALAEKPPLAPERPSALVYGNSGYVQGRATLVHEILEAAGLRNRAAEAGITGEAAFPIERIVLDPPDFLVLLSYHEEHPTLGAMLLRHRALRRLSDGMHRVEIPLSWTITGNHLSVAAAERLREEVERALDGAETGEVP